MSIKSEYLIAYKCLGKNVFIFEGTVCKKKKEKKKKQLHEK